MTLAVSGVAAPFDAFAYRTAGDLPDFEGTERVRWRTPRIPYQVVNDPPYGISIDDALEETSSAFEIWTAPQCSQVWFEHDGVTNLPAVAGDGVNTIEWVHVNWTTRGYPESSAAVSDVQYEKDDDVWYIVEADLYINADTVDWSYGSQAVEGTHRFRAMMVHEAGHLLGLMHPCEPEDVPVPSVPACDGSEEYDVTMNPEYSSDADTLSDDDVEGVCFLYPGAECELRGCGPGYDCTSDGCLLVCGSGHCDLSETCLEGACVQLDDSCGEPECPCEEDSDCESEQCAKGQCVLSGARALGASCISDVQCSTEACGPGGTCTTRCEVDEDCGATDLQCEDELCVSTRADFGGECRAGSDCMSGKCLEGYSSEPVCTRECESETPEACPAGWTCEVVEGPSDAACAEGAGGACGSGPEVCAPPPDGDGCGCSMPGRARPPFGQLLLFLPLVLISRRHARRAHIQRTGTKP